jgi:dienelactone hydrolase
MTRAFAIVAPQEMKGNGMAYEIERKPVTIWSEGSRLAGEILRPKDAPGLRPAILLCHGWAGLKGHLALRYATPFAEAGYVCLVFDYRGWGESDGRMISTPDTPMLREDGEHTVKVRVIRDLVDPIDQAADIRACLAYLISEEGVDTNRIGLWGSSFGGGHVIVVGSEDDRVKAIVAQIGGFGVPNPAPEAVAFQRQRMADKARAAIDPPVPQKIDAAPSLRGVPDVARMYFHSPLRAAERIRVPTLFLDAEFEEYAPADSHGLIATIVARNAVSERVTYPGSHYKVYDEFLEPALKAALDWYEKYL